MRVAYFTNHYPAVSHTFIRREIRALESLGVTVHRYALRSDPNIMDPADRSELPKTRYIFDKFVSELIRCLPAQLFSNPIALLGVLLKAVAMGWRSERGMIRHFVYVAEATVLGAWCKRDGIEHLHVHFGTNPAAVAMFASQLTGIPYSFTAHGPDEFEKAPLLSMGEKLESAAFAVCVSHFGRSQLMRWTAPSQWSKVKLVHCGVEESYLTCPVQPIPRTPRFVCVGRLDERKAQLVLLAAARRLHVASVDFTLVLAGGGSMHAALEEAILDYGLTDKVSITGWVSGDRVRAEIEASRAMILPSFSENLPVVIMEALALGRPVISTYIAGIPELVAPGKNGWLVPASDEIALAEAMLEAIRAAPEELAAMGAEGRLEVSKNHSAQIEARKLKILFEGRKSAQESFLPAANVRMA
jgi:colanic acid/amylovoran biosynthesis glycosyltransferase